MTAGSQECDPCDEQATRFCAIGALIRAAFNVVGEREWAHQIGWELAAEIAVAADLRRVGEDEPGWSLAALSDRRGQAAVLKAIDRLAEQRRT